MNKQPKRIKARIRKFGTLSTRFDGNTDDVLFNKDWDFSQGDFTLSIDVRFKSLNDLKKPILKKGRR